MNRTYDIMIAKDLMTGGIEAVTRDDTVVRAANIMREADIGMVPVVADRETMRPVGVITDRDIAVRYVAEEATQGTVADYMTEGLVTITPETPLEEILDLMAEKKIRRLVVTQDEQVVGVIAQADVAIKTSDRFAEPVEATVEEISKPV